MFAPWWARKPMGLRISALAGHWGGQGPVGVPISHAWPKGINDAAEAPGVLLADRGELHRPGADRLLAHPLGIVDDQQEAAGRRAARIRVALELGALEPGRGVVER